MQSPTRRRSSTVNVFAPARDTAAGREFYGFVIFISAYVLFVLYLVWMATPDSVLESIGITYYPDRYWGFVFPIWTLLWIPFTLAALMSFMLFQTPPPGHITTMTDEFARPMPDSFVEVLKTNGETNEIHDIPISLVSRALYLNRPVAEIPER
ncbi:PIG-P-domain-containing protein [Cladochytrium replicatum]|nr:PIG-P-domain-containing protein [Cladochytrium replicatum]